MTIYTVALSKGGSTKTTTAAELTARLAREGRKVVAVDLDQQGNLTTRLGVTGESEVEAVAADVLAGDATVTEAAFPSPSVPGAWIVAGTNDLLQIDTSVVPDLVTALRDDLARAAGDWDDVVIDTPPSLDNLTLSGLAAADVVVVSMACEVESMDQIARLQAFIEHKLAKRVRPDLQIGWIVPTRYSKQRSLDGEIIERVTAAFPGRVTSPVREGVAVKDSYASGQPVSVYDPTSNPAMDYLPALTPVIASSTEAGE